MSGIIMSESVISRYARGEPLGHYNKEDHIGSTKIQYFYVDLDPQVEGDEGFIKYDDDLGVDDFTVAVGEENENDFKSKEAALSAIEVLKEWLNIDQNQSYILHLAQIAGETNSSFYGEYASEVIPSQDEDSDSSYGDSDEPRIQRQRPRVRGA